MPDPTDCLWTSGTQDLKGYYTYFCPQCKKSSWKTRYPSKQVHRVCTLPPPPVLDGVGSQLAEVLSWLGVQVKETCGCANWILWMNAIGPRGCWAHREVIIDRLAEESKEHPVWKDRFTRKKAKALLWLLVATSPPAIRRCTAPARWAARWLVRWAIRRAEATPPQAT